MEEMGRIDRTVEQEQRTFVVASGIVEVVIVTQELAVELAMLRSVVAKHTVRL
jgi:hypothetical protein